MDTSRAKDWLLQAREELSSAELAFSGQKYSLACFLSQQAAEKALKAVAIFKGYDILRSHSVMLISQELKLDPSVSQAGQVLDQYYISTRYPDALPSGAPFQFFTETQASQAIKLAEIVLSASRKILESL